MPMAKAAAEPNTGALPPRIQDAVTRLEVAKANVLRIRTMIEQANRDRADADREYRGAFAALAEAEATAALDGAVPDDRLRKKAEQHQRALLTHDARIAGLRSREHGAAAEVDAAMSAVSRALDTWTAAKTDEARKAFQAATERFIHDVTGPCAVGIALGDPRLTFAAKSSQVPALDDASRNACWQIRAWRENPAMMATVHENVAVQQAVSKALSGARELVRMGEQTDLGGTAA
jgi:hypothetical protein